MRATKVDIALQYGTCCNGEMGAAWMLAEKMRVHAMVTTQKARVGIVHAVSPERVDLVRGLMREYGDSLGVDLSYQNFEEELRLLPGEYAPPRGTLLLALDGEEAAGCVAIRPLGQDFCEMKRLYVRPAWRAVGLGRRLVEAALEDARRAGYRFVRLDTLPSMTAARGLYAQLGFRAIAPYYQSPIVGTAFLQLDLATTR
ncbi:MAG: GNAT family N-acetyltransferase [Candidatus Acidiferrales bacterium]